MKVKYSILALFFLNAQVAVIHSQNAGQTYPELERFLFTFGVIADIQYADADKAGARDYRNSIVKLENCIDEFNNHTLSFVVNLGDMIDHNYASYDKPLAILDNLRAPVYNVLGNHDFSVGDPYKTAVRERLNNSRGYLDFTVCDFNFIILDGSDVSTFAAEPGTARYNAAKDEYEKMKRDSLNNAYDWNGGIGRKQLKWLEKLLKETDRSGRKAIIFCHWPLLPENGTQLWNNKEVLDLIERHESVVAWIAGHHHAGGYQKTGTVHHLIMKGLVESRSDTSCGIIEVYSDRLVLKGYGDQESKVMEFPE